jgi:hypothetical protein
MTNFASNNGVFQSACPPSFSYEFCHACEVAGRFALNLSLGDYGFCEEDLAYVARFHQSFGRQSVEVELSLLLPVASFNRVPLALVFLQPPFPQLPVDFEAQVAEVRTDILMPARDEQSWEEPVEADASRLGVEAERSNCSGAQKPFASSSIEGVES